jgi:hypothetical protein
MVLRGQHNVLRTGSRKHVSPVIWIEQLGVKLGREILIRKVCAVALLMECPCAGLNCVSFGVVLAARHRIPIPLRVGKLSGQDWSVSRHRVGAPVNKDPELGIAKPGGCGRLSIDSQVG